LFTLLYLGLTALTIWSVRRIVAKPLVGVPAAAMEVACIRP
jgi:hypothetical protein